VAKFQKGQSGNPAGKPKGAKDGRTEMRALLQPHAEKLIQTAVNLALAGDVQALRICVDRIIPPVREDRLQIDLPPITDAAGCAEAQAAIMKAVASGELLPSQGDALAGLVEHRRKALDTSEMTKRLEAIEEQLNMRAKQ
jgi:hypothetical protein